MRLIESMTLVALGLMTAISSADTIYVCWDGSGDYLTIQEGIDAAQDGDEVVVCDGVYTGTGNKNLDFAGKPITVRSASADPNTCVIDCEGSGRGFYFYSGETAESVVEGLTIDNGDASSGGGVLCVDDSSPTISNCAITNCDAISGWGGGVYCESSSPTITDCTITGNVAGGGGAGIACEYNSHPVITNCTITGNWSDGWVGGGGVFCSDSSAMIANSIIAVNYGGYALYGNGGAVYCTGDTVLTMINCTIVGNGAGQYGGALCCRADCNLTITNCRIAGNFSHHWGGGVYSYASRPTIAYCTFAGNTARWGGGGVACESYSDVTLTGCVLWGDLADNGGQEIHIGATDGPSAVTVSYSDVQGGETGVFVADGCTLNWGDGNIDSDPLFPAALSGVWSANATYDPEKYQITFIDTGADWTDGELMGMLLNADTDPHVYAPYLVVTNSQTTITVWADETTIQYGGLWGDFAGRSYEIHDQHVIAGSPCIDAADNEAVPADELDLDEDGDTDEPIPFDLDGQPRFVDDPDTEDTGNPDPDFPELPIVDMGAYEFQVCAGDIDGDNDTDHADLGALLGAWGSQPGDPNWNEDADLDGDGEVGHGDLAIFLADWGCGT